MPRCKSCKTKFVSRFFLQKFCLQTEQCKIDATQYGIAEVKKKSEQDWKKEKKVLKEKLKTHKDYLRDLQTIFNTYIRLRDANLSCVSCGTANCEEFHAGHYIASTFQYLRFNEFNVWKQCSRCNTYLRGNTVPYRIELIKRIGLQEVEKLESSRHKTEKFSIPELIAKIVHYKMQIKILKEKK